LRPNRSTIRNTRKESCFSYFPFKKEVCLKSGRTGKWKGRGKVERETTGDT